MTPKVTIGICAKDCAKIIPYALESIFAQDYPHELLEIILVDDGSKDSTLSVAHKFSKKTDISMKVFHHDWRGVGFTRNFIVSNAQGKYLIWVDSDETIDTNYVRMLVSTMETNPEIGICVGILKISNNNLITKLDLLPFQIERLQAIRYGKLLKPPGTGGAAFRLDVLRRAGGFDESLSGAGEDVDTGERIVDLGWSIAAVACEFSEARGGVETFSQLVKRYFWYGYGNHKVHWKNPKAIGFATMNPVAGLFSGTLYGIEGYKLTKEKKVVILLPASFTLKYFSWCIGFTQSHFEKLRKTRKRGTD